MEGKTTAPLELAIAHVLFMDIVGYSKLTTKEQNAAVATLNGIVQNCEPFQTAENTGRLLKIPTGDGMALVFYSSPEEAVKCAVAVNRALKALGNLPVRMGIHSGSVSGVMDVSGRPNVAGAGINIAQRTMACGDDGHILLSKHAADDLAEYEEWRPLLHDLGDVEVKHGQRINIANLYSDEIGNPALPEKITGALRAKKRRRLAWSISGSLSLLLAAVTIWWLRNIGPATPPEKSIAVLPLENLSESKENAFFADGIHEDILTTLGKIRDLKVISRTSVMQFRGAARNLRDIGKTLGVANILEGSVRRSANRVLVNVQLVDARTDRQIWAERYDRALADAIGVQGELATQIASALQARLAPEEQIALARKPSNNAHAYELYLKAGTQLAKVNASRDDEIAATRSLEEAIALDPNFALALARLSMVHTHLASGDADKDRIAKAKHEAQEALRLSPSLGEAHLAIGFHLFICEKDYASALTELSIAARSLPNHPGVLRHIARIYRRQGHWKESLTKLQRAEELDPVDLTTVGELGDTYMLVRDWTAATAAFSRALAFAPESVLVKHQLALLRVYAEGNLGAAREMLAQIPQEVDQDGDVGEVRWNLCMLQRDFSAAEQALAAFPQHRFSSLDTTLKTFLQGQLALARGDREKAREIFAKLGTEFEAWIREHPDTGEARDSLALLYALMGRKEQAIAEALRAIELEPITQDAYHGSFHQANLALVYAQTGEPEKAIDVIEGLLVTPGPIDWLGGPTTITLSHLRLGWLWDPLRQNLRFQKIIAGPEPKTLY